MSKYDIPSNTKKLTSVEGFSVLTSFYSCLITALKIVLRVQNVLTPQSAYTPVCGSVITHANEKACTFNHVLLSYEANGEPQDIDRRYSFKYAL